MGYLKDYWDTFDENYVTREDLEYYESAKEWVELLVDIWEGKEPDDRLEQAIEELACIYNVPMKAEKYGEQEPMDPQEFNEALFEMSVSMMKEPPLPYA